MFIYCDCAWLLSVNCKYVYYDGLWIWKYVCECLFLLLCVEIVNCRLWVWKYMCVLHGYVMWMIF